MNTMAPTRPTELPAGKAMYFTLAFQSDPPSGGDRGVAGD